MNLLIVDDDPQTCRLLDQHLSPTAEIVMTYTDSSEALSVLKEQPDLVDVVLCDLHMPGIDGLQFLQQMELMQASQPVIMLSSQPDLHSLQAFLRSAVYDFFQKPIADMELLKTKVKAAHTSKQRKQNTTELQQLNEALERNLLQLQVDLQAGRYVQRKMLADSPKQVGNYRFSHRLIASSYLSGDFVEYVLVGDRYVSFFIADVSGHGASSAFITVLLKNITARLRSAWFHDGDERIISPARFVNCINEELLDLESGKHATMFMGVLDMQTDTVDYCIAGHHPPMILKQGGQTRYIDAKGKPVGLFPDCQVEEHRIDLEADAQIFLFSDGILEVLDGASMLEKEQHLLDIVDKTPLKSLADLNNAIDFDEEANFTDDIAMLLLQRNQT